ncbi:MAG TPA: HypC/HybG/HupF family hydrogenase formation chaperone [Candidatus Sulfotelmatobacter sp.]|nr:HypC/HybG/HupF family hydrogenase formation chaperone [Candidatus Sulfotelmatobacter sp.]
MCLAIPARLVEYLDEEHNYGKVELGGVIRRVNTSMLRGEDDAEPGDHVLVHVGFAMAKVSAAEAQNTLRILEEMGSVYEDEIKEIRKSLALGDHEENSPTLTEAAEAYRAEQSLAGNGSASPENGHEPASAGNPATGARA